MHCMKVGFNQLLQASIFRNEHISYKVYIFPRYFLLSAHSLMFCPSK